MTTLRTETIGDAILHLGDCREIVPGLGKVDAVVMDPPYGTQDLGGGYGRRQNWNTGDGLGRVISNDTDLSALAGVFPACVGAIEDGWLLAFYGDRRTPAFVEATRHERAVWFGGVVWDKGTPGVGYHIRYAHETLAVFRVGEPPRPPQALITPLRGGVLNPVHPHEKPMTAMAPLVRWAAQGGGLVLDPFMGSGSTGVACLRAGRRFIGVEVDPQWFDVACRRLEAALKQPQLFPDRTPAEQGAFDLAEPGSDAA